MTSLPMQEDGGMAGEDVEARQLYAKVTARLFGEPEIPVRIGRYRVLQRLGAGAMGVVYAAIDDELGRKLAIKLLHDSFACDPTGRARLLREAQAMARLRHHNVVVVYDVGTHDDQVFIAMELVSGHTLSAWLAASRRSVAEVLACFHQAGAALAAAHRAGVLHRDFKPENILVEVSGRVCVLDFGLARALAEPAPGDPSDSLSEPLTRTGSILGTPAYMAPEQLRGAAVDARADQFSFCVALYEALYGERPFATLPRFAAATVSHQPRDGRVPTWIRRAVLRGLAEDPAQRFPDMDALLAALTRSRSRSRSRLVGAGLLVAVGVGVGAWVARAWQPPERVTARQDVPVYVHSQETQRDTQVASDQRRVSRFHTLFSSDPTRAAQALVPVTADIPELPQLQRLALSQPLTRTRVMVGQVWALQFAADGTLWLADEDGVQHLDATGQIVADPTVPLPPHPSQPEHEPRLRRDHNHRLFLGRRRLAAHAGILTAGAWSPDGTRVALADTPQIHVWGAKGGLLARLEGHEATVRKIVWSPGGDRLLSGSDDGEVRVFPSDGRGAHAGQALVLRGHRAAIVAMAWHPDGRHVATVSDNGELRVWDLVPAAILHDHRPGAVQAIAWHPSQAMLAVGRDDGEFQILDRTRAHSEIRVHGRSVLSVAWSDDGHQLASVGGDDIVRVWRDAAEAPELLKLGTRRGEDALAVAWWDDATLWVASNDERMRRWRWDGQAWAQDRVDMPRTAVLRLLLAPATSEIAAVDVAGVAWRGPVVAGEHGAMEVVRGPALSGDINDLAFCPEGQLVVAREDRRVDRIASDQTLQWQRTTGVPVTSIACGGDGEVVVGLADGRLRRWSVEGGDLGDLRGHTTAIEAVAISPDGSIVASGDRHGHLYLWPWSDAAVAAHFSALPQVCPAEVAADNPEGCTSLSVAQ